MGSLLRPVLWTPPGKPPGGGRINWAHPSSRALLGAWTFNGGAADLLNSYAPTQFSQTLPLGIRDTPAGRGMDGIITGAGANSTAPSSYKPTGSVSIFWRGVFYPATSGHAGPATGAQSTFRTNLTWYSWAVGIKDGFVGPQGNLTAFYDNNGTQVTIDGGIAPTNQPVTMCLSIGTSATFYVNGVVAGTNVFAGPITYDASGCNFQISGVPGDGTAVFQGTSTEVFVWLRAVTQEEVMALTVNPYALLAPVQSYAPDFFRSPNFTQALTGAVSFTGAQTKAVSKKQTAALGFTGAATKATRRPLAGATLSFVGGHAKQAGKSLSGALSFTGAQSKATVRSVSAALGFTGSLPKSTARPLAGVLSFSGAITRRAGRSLTAALGFSGSQSKSITRTLPGALSFTGSANRAVRRTVTGALGFAGTVAKATTRPFSGALSFVGNLATAFGTGAHSYFQSLAGSLDFSGSIGRAIQRPLSASLSPSGALNRAIVRALPGATLSFAGGFAKGTGIPLSGSLSFTGSQSKRIGKQLLGVLSFVGGFVAAKLPGLAQIINVINPPVSGSVVAVMVVQLPGGPAIFYLLSYIPDEVPIGEVATFRVQLAGSDGSRPTPDLAPVARVLDSTGAAVLANTTMTGSGVYSVSWTPTAAGAYSVEVRTALSGTTVAAQIPVTVRPRFDPIALAVSDVLVSRM